MARNIGPALPPHLKKNLEEHSSSEDDSNEPQKPSIYIGPTLPPHLQKSANADPSSEEDEDAYGPALPSSLKGQSSKSYGVSSSQAYPQISRDESSSSDDEIIGPLPPASENNAYDEASEVEKRLRKMKQKLTHTEPIDNQPKREDWMLTLPELKTKQFGLGPRSFQRTEKPEIKGRDQWTSTPTTQKTELDDNEEPEVKMPDPRELYLEEKRNKRLEIVVEEHNTKKKRSKSLLNAHQEEIKKRKKGEDSKPKERRPFDRDEDLKANQFDDAKRKALIKKSQELNTKFKVGGQKFL